MLESHVNGYQMDVYGFITNTNFKYILLKNETKISPSGMRPLDDQVRALFKVLIRAHTELLLNPFFEPSEGGGAESELIECYDEDSDEDLNSFIGNSRYMEVLNL